MTTKKDAPQQVSVCDASQMMLEAARKARIETVFDRAAAMKPCPIGTEGICCKQCAMGPCRVTSEKSAGKKAQRGLCGATAETIVARNFARMVAAGTAAHADHARTVAEVFLNVARGMAPEFSISDTRKLLQLGMDFGLEVATLPIRDIAIAVGERCLAEFGKQAGELVFCKRAPLKRQELWRARSIMPRGIDREIVELMHRTHMGVDQDYENLIAQAARAALADGWGGSMIATELQDILFGTPVPIAGRINLGVLKEDEVNIIVHGHDPLLSEMMVAAAQNPELIARAQRKGAQGINLAGMCCTASEILLRHGIPVAGNFLQQELAIITGVVDAMVIDVQCEMQSLQQVASCFHTRLITTSPKAKIRGAVHLEFDEHHARTVAEAIVNEAIEAFPNRKAPATVPEITQPMVVGFSHETIAYVLGGTFRASYKPLNENIIGGRIRGVAGVVGCNNARTVHDRDHLELIFELLKHDVLVLTTGCSAMACGKAGLLSPESTATHCGAGLAEVCEAVGIPPVLHLGSCVDNSRILMAATAMVKEGGLGDDISDLPAAGAAPEWMSEKALAIGHYFVASGVYTVFGVTFPTTGSSVVSQHLFSELEKLWGACWDFARDPHEMAHKMIAHIDAKRKALGIDKARERILFDMAMRREMD